MIVKSNHKICEWNAPKSFRGRSLSGRTSPV